MNKKIWAIIIVIILIIVGVWYYQNSQPVPAAGEPIKIGAALALTGYASVWGEVERNSIKMAVDEFNQAGGIDGKPVEVVFEDIQSDNAKSVTAVTKLLSVDKVKFIIGPTWADSFGGSLPLIDQYNAFLITPSASITAMRGISTSDRLFSTYYRTDDESKKLVEYLNKIGKKKIALVFENDAFWQDIAQHVKEYSGPVGITIVSEFKTASGQTDFRTDLVKIQKDNPDAVIFGLNSDKSILPFLKQYNGLSIKASLFTTESNEEYVTQDDFAGLTDSLFIIAPDVASESFLNKYEKQYSSNAVFSASNAYDATNILLEAMKNSTEPEDVVAYLRGHEFETVTFGLIKFDDIGGVNGSKFVIKSAKENKLESIEKL